MLVGIIAGVTARRIDPGLSGWEEFWIVLIASVSAAMIIWLIGWLWRETHRPKIVVECGNDDEYHYQLSSRSPRQAAILSHEIRDIYTTRLRVREIRGIRAVDVQVRALLGDQPPRVFQWLNEADVYTIEGNIPAYVRLCEAFEYTDGHIAFRSHHPDIRPGKCAEIEVEAVVAGRKLQKRPIFRFGVDWTAEDARYPKVSAK